MKINGVAIAEPLQQVEAKKEEKVAAAPRKAPGNGDVVELSAALDGQGTARLEESRARRVAEIKYRLEDGSYRVDSRLVAEKVLSAGVGF